MKPEIRFITATSGDGREDCVYGLATDGNIYFWNRLIREWVLEHKCVYEGEKCRYCANKTPR
jgi:hypothetical protein